MQDPQVEVREQASSALTALLLPFATSELCVTMTRRFEKLASTPLPSKQQPAHQPTEAKAMTTKSQQQQIGPVSSALARRHAGVLGLCSLCMLSPFDVPEWLPPVVASISNHVRDLPPIGSSARHTIADFKRSHQGSSLSFCFSLSLDLFSYCDVVRANLLLFSPLLSSFLQNDGIYSASGLRSHNLKPTTQQPLLRHTLFDLTHHCAVK